MYSILQREVIRMSDGVFEQHALFYTPGMTDLTDTQRAELREDLTALHKQLTAYLTDGSDSADTVELDQSRMGRVSRNDALQQQQMAKAGIRRAELRLSRIEAAMSRYDDDPAGYGSCPDCAEDIDFRRLKAFPESIFCVPCAQERGA